MRKREFIVFGCLSDKPVLDDEIELRQVKIVVPAIIGYDRAYRDVYNAIAELAGDADVTFEVYEDPRSREINIILYALPKDVPLMLKIANKLLEAYKSDTSVSEQNVEPIVYRPQASYRHRSALENLVRLKIANVMRQLGYRRIPGRGWYKGDFRQGHTIYVRVEILDEGYARLFFDVAFRSLQSLADVIWRKYGDNLKRGTGIRHANSLQELFVEAARQGKRTKIERLFKKLGIMEYITSFKGKDVWLRVKPATRKQYELRKVRITEICKEWSDKHVIRITSDGKRKIPLSQYLDERRPQKKGKHIAYPVLKLELTIKGVTKSLSGILQDLFISRYRWTERRTKATHILFDLIKQFSEKARLRVFGREIQFVPLEFLEGERVSDECFEICLRSEKPFSITKIPPIKMLEKDEPLARPQSSILLCYVAPIISWEERWKDENLVREIIRELHRLIKDKFESLHLGSLCEKPIMVFYRALGDVETMAYKELYGTMDSALDDQKKEQKHVIFPIVIVPRHEEMLFAAAKECASSKGFHSQILEVETVEDILDGIKSSSERRRKAVDGYIANLCLAIHIEAVLQTMLDRIIELEGLNWRLHKPADKKGESIYVGFDVSWDSKRRMGAALFVVCDPWGRKIYAARCSVSADRLTYEGVFRTFMKLLTKLGRVGMKSIRRVVFYRDGPFKQGEVQNILRAFDKIRRALNVDLEVDLIEVIKNVKIRVLMKKARKIANELKNINSLINVEKPDVLVKMSTLPRCGFFIYHRKILEDEQLVHEVLVFTAPEYVIRRAKGRFVKPVMLRIRVSKRNYKDIIEEYVSLCNLNFWSMEGQSKLCLPLKLADKLANMIRLDVPIKLPSL